MEQWRAEAGGEGKGRGQGERARGEGKGRGQGERARGRQGGVAADLVGHEEELLLKADVGVQAPDLVAELLEEPLTLAAERLGEVGGDRGEVSPSRSLCPARLSACSGR